jgi:putative membrane protein
MTKQIITMAAAAALAVCTIGGVSRAADETNPDATGAGSGSNVSDGSGQVGQTGAANTGAMNMAQRSERDMQDAIRSANDPDKLFLVCAAIDNRCEMELAQLAQTKAQDQKVKDLAQKMLQDHQQADRQLQEAAQQTGVIIPRGLPLIKQQALKVFQSLSGRDFDQQFISHMRAAHAKAVNEYQDVAQLARNDQIKQFASKTLPTLQQHYQDVQQEATALGLPSGMEAQPAGARMPGSSGGTNR